jgi:serine protease Do
MKLIRHLIFSLLVSFVATSYAADFPSLSPMLEKTRPAIVNILAQGTLAPRPLDPSNSKQKMRALKPKPFEHLGSGVVIDASKGYIVSNAHVIHNAKTITVTLFDGRHEKAKVIGADTESDIAVLQIKPRKIKALKPGNSSTLKVGDFVVAIGNPFGLNSFGNNQSATFGIVSALQRNTLNIEGVENFIQTDAAINPGNSGGALVNTKGELIGINTAILTPFGGNIGIGFAIPIDLVKDVVQQLIKYGSVDRGLMGIFVQQLTPELADAFSLPTQTKGALVTQVNAKSPAARAGLMPGDVILKINNTPIADAAQVKTTIALLRVGGNAHITLVRNGKKVELNTVVSSLKQHEEQVQKANPFLYGLALVDFSQQSPLHGFVKGVQVVGASEASNAWQAGIRPGDVIISANHSKTDSLQSLETESKKRTSQLLLHILRGPGALFVLVS